MPGKPTLSVPFSASQQASPHPARTPELNSNEARRDRGAVPGGQRRHPQHDPAPQCSADFWRRTGDALRYRGILVSRDLAEVSSQQRRPHEAPEAVGTVAEKTEEHDAGKHPVYAEIQS